MSEQDKVDVLSPIMAGYVMLTSDYDAKRQAFDWNCGRRSAFAAGFALGCTVTTSAKAKPNVVGRSFLTTRKASSSCFGWFLFDNPA